MSLYFSLYRTCYFIAIQCHHSKKLHTACHVTKLILTWKCHSTSVCIELNTSMLFNSVPSLNHHSNWTAIRGIVSKNHNSQGKMTMNKLPGLFFAETFQLGRSSSYGPNYYVLRMSHPASTPLTPPTVITVSEACTWVADTHLATYSLRRSSQWRSEKRAMSWEEHETHSKLFSSSNTHSLLLSLFFFNFLIPSSPSPHPLLHILLPYCHTPTTTNPSQPPHPASIFFAKDSKQVRLHSTSGNWHWHWHHPMQRNYYYVMQSSLSSNSKSLF